MISGPMKSPRKPISFNPTNIEISVGSGDNPIWEPIIFGSTVLPTMSRMTARIANFVAVAISPLMNRYNDQGARITMDPSIGMISIIQITRDIITAYLGMIKRRPTNVTARIIKLINSWAFMKPKITELRFVII